MLSEDDEKSSICSICIKRRIKTWYIGDMYSEVNALGQFQMLLDVFDNRILMQFEDTELYMPREYDKILRGMYGDYMTHPLEENERPMGLICEQHYFISRIRQRAEEKDAELNISKEPI